jgi:glycosyltransferase involved in cell wall biosynthesis
MHHSFRHQAGATVNNHGSNTICVQFCGEGSFILAIDSKPQLNETPIDAPHVSLHMAVHNTRDFITTAVKSIFAQTFRSFDLTLWDDGSTDGSFEMAEQLARTFPTLKVLRSTHQGVAASLRAAIATSRGSYIGSVDSDDMLAPTALEETVQFLDENPHVGVVYTDHYETNEAGTKAVLSNLTKIPYSRDRLLMDFMTFHFRLMRRSAYDACGGFDPSLTCAVDYDLCLRLSEVASFAHLPKPLYYYRRRRGSITQSRRVEQINASTDAVRRAIQRRKLDVELHVELISKFFLVRPTPASLDTAVPPDAKGRTTT